MKILFVGNLNSYARAKQRFLAMEDLGHSVEPMMSVVKDAWLNKPSLYERVRHKLRYPIDSANLNNNLPPKISKLKPDLIWVEKANTIWFKTYKKVKDIFPDIKIVYYSEDDIYLSHNRSKYLTKSLELFDAVFTTKPRNLNELPELGVKKCICVYQAYDKNFHKPVKINLQEKEKWGADVSFVGSFEQDRAEKMFFLAENGIKVRVWGNNWQTWSNKHPNLIVEGKAVFDEDFIKVINSTKINLNFLRKMNRDLHTNRSLEIPACQGFMLAERTNEHQHLFLEKQEAEYFDSNKELLAKVEYYLAHEEERQKIAQAGRVRCIESGYSHHARLKIMLEALQK